MTKEERIMPVSGNVYSSVGHMPTAEQPNAVPLGNGEYNVGLRAYMSSRIGRDSETNRDNYYMNGLCAKNFKFSDMDRPYLSELGSCGIFAVSRGIVSDRASKLVMRVIDERREWLAASKSEYRMKSRLSELVRECGRVLISEGQEDGADYEASLAIAVYFRDSLFYAVCGDAAAVKVGSGGVTRLRSKCGNLGRNMAVRPYVGRCAVTPDDRLVLLTKGAQEAAGPEELCCRVSCTSEPDEIAKDIMERVYYSGTDDATCMAVAAEPAGGIHTKTMVIAMLCLLWTLINVLILILNW